MVLAQLAVPAASLDVALVVLVLVAVAVVVPVRLMVVVSYITTLRFDGSSKRLASVVNGATLLASLPLGLPPPPQPSLARFLPLCPLAFREETNFTVMDDSVQS